MSKRAFDKIKAGLDSAKAYLAVTGDDNVAGRPLLWPSALAYVRECLNNATPDRQWSCRGLGVVGGRLDLKG